MKIFVKNNSFSAKKSAFSLIEISIVLLIIGIIIAGVTQGSIMIQKYRLSTARSMTQSSPVNSISDLVFWFEPTLIESFGDDNIEDGDPVQLWRDINPQSTVKYDASSDSVSASPTYQTNCISSLPCLSFDGNNDELTTATNNALGVHEFTLFMITRLDLNDIDTSQYLIKQASNSASDGSLYIYINSSSSLIYPTASYGNYSSTTLTDSFQLTEDVKNYMIHFYESSEESITMNINKSQAVNITTNLQADGERSIEGFIIGGGANTYELAGKISEIIFFDRNLKATEVTAVENYLMQKWKIKSDL